MFEDYGDLDVKVLMISVTIWLIVSYMFIKAQTMLSKGGVRWGQTIIGIIIMLPLFYFVIKWQADRD
jgi:uncharacterized membrane protein (DUF441 family)